MTSTPNAPTALLRPRGWRAVAVWAVAWVAMLALDGRLELANLALLLVLAAAVASLWLAPWISLLVSSLAVAAFNWTFVPPRGTFVVGLRQHALLLAAMLGVSWIVALLMARQRLLAARAEDQARRAEQLHRLGDALRDTDDPMDCATLLRDALAALCGGPVALLLLNGPLPERDDAGTVRLMGEADADMRAGLWQSLRRSVAFGPGTGRYDELGAWILPMRGRSGSRGAAGLTLPQRPRDDDTLRAHAQALCDQMGLALERTLALQGAALARQEAGAQQLRNTLLAAISHDYRTPLATIMGAASSLRDQGERLSPQQRRRAAATIVDEVEQLGRMTDNTLQLARLDAPGRELRLDWESAEEIVGTVMRRLRARDAAHRVRAQLEPGLPLLRCDALLLVQLLENLVDNALKYADAATPVEIVVRRHGEHVILAVRDRGPGVPLAWRERVFDAFQRGAGTAVGGAADAPARRGAGVGLAVCRAIARAHGGELTLRPRSHGGTSFECALPVPEAPPEPDRDGGAA